MTSAVPRPRLPRPAGRAAATLAVAVALVAGAPAVRAERTDVVVLENGDAVTGEIKQLKRGLLRYKTDSAGTLQIEWEEVLSIRSRDSFEVETSTGARYYGRLETVPDGDPAVRVIGEDGDAVLFLESIVRIHPIESSFVKRIDGGLNLGFGYTKASDVSQLSFGFRADYRSRRFVTGVSMDSNVTTERDEPTSSRNDVKYYFEKFRVDRWFSRWTGGVQTNDEIGLERRSQLSWLGGRYLVQSNHAVLALGAGVAVSRESRSGEDDATDNLDLVLSVDHQLWQFRYPKRDLSVSWLVYPSLSAWGRVRSDLDASARFELFTDFFFELGLYGSYDNRPPEDASSSTDYGLTTSLSWTF